MSCVTRISASAPAPHFLREKGKAGVALVRVSGAEAIEISSKVFVPRGRKLSEVPSNTAAFGDIYSGGEKFDSGIATVFRAPKSFTGEDTVEICCHGSEVGISMLLAALFESRCRSGRSG